MSRQVQDAYIVAAARLPIGKRNGYFKTTRPDDMLVHAIKTILNQTPALDPALIDDIVGGCALPEAEQGLNVTRMAAMIAGLPPSVPGVQVNRFCSSGLQAVAMAADRIRVGDADVMIGCGTETMSMVTMLGNKIVLNPRIFENDANLGIAFGMGITAEKVAEQWQVSREDQDAFAAASNQKAIAAIRDGKFKDETTPFTVQTRVPDPATGQVKVVERVVVDDEGPRADATPEKLAQMRPVFAAKGTVTAGNSSQMSDGSGALLLVSEKILKQFNLQPLARFVSYSVRGVKPEVMGIGPIEAIPDALKKAGLQKADLQWIELNEAFAAQSLAVIRSCELDPAVVNPLGGAIALGHPLGATGAIRTATLIHGLRREKMKYGMVTMCIGHGMGAAGIFEAL
ncbi:MAG TPA: acetyl-CoA C-acyltransferase [Accumulibacter sp.]|nr:acetyl-CoA C-acyltransferase [Accumulibacter sp.]HMW17698.1 acetyl-CoA C-acyltransferase [Accumulibacter sp.]HMX22236.1 acetyl-CoA C-acyltransferase [Accumulibacter sp.]HMY07761.1 acetyl-CoA C-acyltransferase [Accumulibacter sp.]HNC18038.1 acetyl-CoA C-acyltransferase [Accumulibacter sp.]